MAKKFLFYFLFISVLGVSQVTLINNSNLNGFVVSNINPLSAIVTKSNTSSQIGVTSGFCNVNITIYPNPVNEILNIVVTISIDLTGIKKKLELINAFGQIVQTKYCVGQTTKIN